MNKGLGQLGQQLLAIWKQLGVSQRITVVATTLGTLVGIAAMVMWSGRTEYSLLYGKLDEAEAGKVVAALNDAKIPYKIGAGGGSILVPADKVHTMRMQLATKGIPRSGDGVGFEIFDKPNFGISDFVQRANYLRAVQGELARTISQVDAVEAARVMIVMPENRLLTDNTKRPTGSVFVRVRGNATLPTQTVNAIRFLVANAVEGLSANFVTVVDNLGNVLSENSEDGSLGGLSNTQLAARKNLEQYLSKKAEGMLDKVLGQGYAVVRVAAELNFDTVQRTEEKFDPDGQVLRSGTQTDENTDTLSSNSNTGGGAPGATANASTETNNVATLPSSRSNTKKKVSNQQYEINKSSSTLMQAAGGIKRISAAVFVAMRVEGTGESRKPVPRTKEELEKLRGIVRSAIGIQDSADGIRKDEIVLEEMPFNDQPAQEIAQQITKQEKKEMMFNIGRSLLYPGIALVFFMVMMKTFKKTPTESIPLGVPVGDYAGYTNGNGHSNGNGRLHFGNGNGNGRNVPSVVTVDVLNQLIKENPNNVTQAIRTWMTRGTNKS